RDEFEAACAAYASCVKPGGMLAAAFLVRSGGYIVADRPFPVLHLLAEEIEETFARHGEILKSGKGRHRRARDQERLFGLRLHHRKGPVSVLWSPCSTHPSREI
ncbi:MAG TPA: hypothetical protein VLD66_09425, partial [Methyloceanibacter sp.]|nr:hypothetical protein [Methyloceanibacter sp.]